MTDQNITDEALLAVFLTGVASGVGTFAINSGILCREHSDVLGEFVADRIRQGLHDDPLVYMSTVEKLRSIVAGEPVDNESFLMHPRREER